VLQDGAIMLRYQANFTLAIANAALAATTAAEAPGTYCISNNSSHCHCCSINNNNFRCCSINHRHRH
jgi:hypothetical protein